MTNSMSRAAGLVLLLATPWMAHALDVVPSITLAEIYTSNVNLDPPGSEQDEWVTQISPRIEIGYEGNRLDLRLDYALEALFYADVSERNEVYNHLGSSALLDLVAEELQLVANASISQVNLEPDETVSNSNINTTGSRSNAFTWSVGPQWERQLFAGSEFDGHALFGRVNYDEGGTQDIRTTNARVSLHTDNATNPTVTYDLAYEYDHLEYEITGETMVQTAYLELGYQVNDNYRVFALGGLDNNFVDSTTYSDSLDEPRWELGILAVFTADTFRIGFGERHFGSTFDMSWEHVESDATYSLSYDESPTTSDLATLREIPTGTPSETPEEPPPDTDINRPGNPTRYVRKRADANASWSFYRSTLSLNAFWEDREDQVLVVDTLPDPTSLDDETSYGANANFSWEVGSRSVASFGASWRNRTINNFTEFLEGEPLTSVDDDLYTLQAALDYTLGVHTSLGLSTGFRSRVTSAADNSGDYDEYWASVRLVRTF